MIAAETFWSINAAQIVMLVTIIGGFATWFSRFEGRIRSTSEALKVLTTETERTFSELIARITQIDREGTRKSQQSIAADEKLYEINTRRIDKLEEITLKLAPQVA